MATVVGETEGEVAADAVAPSKSNRKRLMIVGGAVLVLLLVGGLAAFFMLKPAAAAKPVKEEVPAEAFVDVPAIIVNLRSADGTARLIKLHVLLVPNSLAVGEDVKARLPLVIDAFQPFLRELRPEDLAGSAAVFRIKEELLVRANAVTGGGKVDDVLVQDLVQQ